MFGFMSSAVSSEKPQALQVRQIASRIRDVKADGGKVLWVAGPAVVHTGADAAMVALVDAGYVDVLFAGNALATHDIEASLYGTSLGVDLAAGRGVEHGHEHHIRAINTIRREGSIADAVASGRADQRHHARDGEAQDKQFVLVGSVRDDGPLPDVYTDVIEGQRAMRAALRGVGLCIMVATMLHSIATGNLLPASVPLVSVDINPATVTKLADRGSAQAIGMVTDIGLFLEQLATELVPELSRDPLTATARSGGRRTREIGGADQPGLRAEHRADQLRLRAKPASGQPCGDTTRGPGRAAGRRHRRPRRRSRPARDRARR